MTQVRRCTDFRSTFGLASAPSVCSPSRTTKSNVPGLRTCPGVVSLRANVRPHHSLVQRIHLHSYQSHPTRSKPVERGALTSFLSPAWNNHRFGSRKGGHSFVRDRREIIPVRKGTSSNWIDRGPVSKHRVESNANPVASWCRARGTNQHVVRPLRRSTCYLRGPRDHPRGGRSVRTQRRNMGGKQAVRIKQVRRTPRGFPWQPKPGRQGVWLPSDSFDQSTESSTSKWRILWIAAFPFVSAKALRTEADWSLETSVPLQVVYTLSPFQQSVMSGLFKDIPSKLSKKISEVREQLGGNRCFKGKVWIAECAADLEMGW